VIHLLHSLALAESKGEYIADQPRQLLSGLVHGAVAGVVEIESGVVSGVINLESSGVEAPDWRPRHDKS
jgi:hypothetical protein